MEELGSTVPWQFGIYRSSRFLERSRENLHYNSLSARGLADSFKIWTCISQLVCKELLIIFLKDSNVFPFIGVAILFDRFNDIDLAFLQALCQGYAKEKWCWNITNKLWFSNSIEGFRDYLLRLQISFLFYLVGVGIPMFRLENFSEWAWIALGKSHCYWMLAILQNTKHCGLCKSYRTWFLSSKSLYLVREAVKEETKQKDTEFLKLVSAPCKISYAAVSFGEMS